MDSIRITITRDVDKQGKGGTVVDDASAVLGNMPDGTPILDVLAAAFAASYGVHEVDTGKLDEDGQPIKKPVTPFRNVAYRMRQFATEVVSGFAQNQARALAADQASKQIEATLQSLTIVEAGDGK